MFVWSHPFDNLFQSYVCLDCNPKEVWNKLTNCVLCSKVKQNKLAIFNI